MKTFESPSKATHIEAMHDSNAVSRSVSLLRAPFWTSSLALLLAATQPAAAYSVSGAGFSGLSSLVTDEDAVAASAKKALALRNASGGDWDAGKYAAAAEKLAEALAIYHALNADSGDEGGFVDERAVTLRALVWNEFRSGAEDAGLQRVESLLDLAESHPAAGAQKGSVYKAIFQHAGAKETLKEAQAFWTAVADIYEAYGDEERLGQILIDRAGSYSRFGDHAEARRQLSAAIEAHLAIEDFDGANWSRNNLGYSFVRSEEWGSAIGPIGAALAEIRAGRGLAAQSALGYNLLEIARGAAAGERPSRELVEGLWSVAEEEARAQKPAIVAPETLLVAAMRAEIARVGAKRAKGAADRLLSALPSGPAALRADLTLHAAALLLDGGAVREAQDLVGSLRIADGPVAAHLTVRQAVLAALASAARKDQRAFDREVVLAIDAVEALGHDATTRDAYEQLSAAAKAFPKSSEARAVQASWQNIKRMGRPGGAGGSSLGGTNGPRVEGLRELDAQAPLFALSIVDGELRAEDLLGGDEATLPLDWVVRTVSFHGMKVELFGGYVAVVDMNYGGRSGAKGSRSGLSLRDVENFRPLAEGSVLYVTKTGATFYGDAAK